MDEKTIIPIITLIVGLIGGYFLTFISDKRKYLFETRRELRLAYARWFSLQRTAFHQITLLFESMLLDSTSSPSENLRQYVDIQEELKEFQTTLLTLLQNVAEVSLLETKEDRLETIKFLDDNLNKFYHLLLSLLDTRNFQVKQLIKLDELVASTVKERNDNKLEEKLKEIRAKHHEGYTESLLVIQASIKELIKTMREIDIDIREFFHSLKGNL